MEPPGSAPRRASVIARAGSFSGPAQANPLSVPLPSAATPLVGRQAELVDVQARLQQPDVRLLTLTGPGGTGKTRLALAAAEALAGSYDRGAVFVDCAPLEEAALVLPAIGHALGIRESAGRSIADGIRRLLVDASLLIVLDNLEHVLAAAPDVADILATVPSIDVLTTSREPLRLRWEYEYPVSPLALPDTRTEAGALTDLAESPAVALLVQRARAVRPGFALTPENAAAVAEICRRLDGLPLAIELAAARLKVLSPVALLGRIERRLDLLAGAAPDAPARHRTLRAAVGWSHDLLAPREQALFARLAVFSGGFTATFAAAVCGDTTPDAEEKILDDLTSLVDKSLVIATEGPDGEPRFRMLETVAEFARERLTELGEAGTRDAHARIVVAFLEETEPLVWGPDQARWRARLMAEEDNVRVAFHWLLSRGDLVAVGRILRRTFFPWWTQGHVAEVRRWALETIAAGEQESAEMPAPTEAIARFAAGFAALEQGSYDEAEAHLVRSLALHEATGDEMGISASTMALAFIRPVHDDLAGALSHAEDAYHRFARMGEEWYSSLASIGCSAMHLANGDAEAAERYAEISLGHARTIGDTWSLGSAHDQMAVMALLRGDPATAVGWVRETIPLCLAAGHTEIVAYGLMVLAIADANAAPTKSARLFGAAESLRDAAGVVIWPSRRWVYEQGQAAVRERLGGALVDAAWAEGRAMTAAAAVAYGLDADTGDDRADAFGGSVTADTRLGQLTPREREVAGLIAAGLTSKEAADRLSVSERTIDAHADHIRTKLSLRSRAEIAAWAVAAGLGRLDPH